MQIKNNLTWDNKPTTELSGKPEELAEYQKSMGVDPEASKARDYSRVREQAQEKFTYEQQAKDNDLARQKDRDTHEADIIERVANLGGKLLGSAFGAIGSLTISMAKMANEHELALIQASEAYATKKLEVSHAEEMAGMEFLNKSEERLANLLGQGMGIVGTVLGKLDPNRVVQAIQEQELMSGRNRHELAMKELELKKAPTTVNNVINLDEKMKEHDAKAEEERKAYERQG